MKIVISFFVLALAGVATLAQDGKVVAEVMARQDGSTVKGQPFSADAVSESVQTLADGNRIVHNSTSKYYRSGDGRTRREMTGGAGGIMGTYFHSEPGFTIMDPSGLRYMVDDGMKTARRIQVLPSKELSIMTAGPLTEEHRKTIDKVRTELRTMDESKLTEEQKATLVKLRSELKTPLIVSGGSAAGGGLFERYPAASKFDSKTEDLGTRNIEGVDCEGTRRVTTIPAGAIGNERAIETVYERWYSKELGVVVYSKNSDPRMGEQTYRLTNIVRAEPDPSLFTLPSGYKVISEPGGAFRVTSTFKADPVKEVRKVKPQQ